MFTGLIEEIGTVETVSKTARSAQLTIRASTVLDGLQIGDSIAVNGACLTVISFSNHKFTADCMAETMRRTNLSRAKPGSAVNLERALQLGSRLGGHIVSGHIDDTGAIQAYEKEDNAVWITVKAPASILRYVVEKGSITIDGVSLTVAETRADHFRVSIIPHTGSATTLLSKKPGDTVNLETDVIGKYVEKLLRPAGTDSEISRPASHNQPSGPQDGSRSGGLSLETLMENGF